MKYISRLLILCLLLCGCGKPEPAVSLIEPPETVVPVGLYDPGSHLEISSSGAVKLYPLGNRKGYGIAAFGGDILLFSGEETTTLTVLTGSDLSPIFHRSLSFLLMPEDCTVEQDMLSYFDPCKAQVVVLNHKLEETNIIPGPAGLIGKPLLAPGGDTLYYCTQTAIKVWDIPSGIHRILRQTSQAPQTIEGLYCDGSVLRCRTGRDSSCFLSVETGEMLSEETSELKLAAEGRSYTAASWETNLWSLVFSLDGQAQQALTPRELSSVYFLLQSPQVITASQTGAVTTLDLYDLAAGQLAASQMFPGTIPLSVVSLEDGRIFGLTYLTNSPEPVIFQWDCASSPAIDPTLYTGPHYTAAEPDRSGLSQCQERAREIGEQYGIDILVWEAAAAQAPQGIAVTPEHRVNILNRELELLDYRLSQFPQGLLQTTSANFEGVTLCLVAQIDGNGHKGYLQYFNGSRAYILLSVGEASEQALHHSLYHVMETHILSHSSALDQWNALNPQGFLYDYDYTINAIRNSGIYLTEKNRTFIDTFSMSYPKEDRARIFEAAMDPDQGSLFSTKAMQKKLNALCFGLREAYRLPEEERYPWEQHLK